MIFKGIKYFCNDKSINEQHLYGRVPSHTVLYIALIKVSYIWFLAPGASGEWN